MRSDRQREVERNGPSLGDVLAVFQAMTGLRAVPRDASGAPVSAEDPGAPRFCRLVRAGEGGAEHCRTCIAGGAPPTGDVRGRLFRCSGGLTHGVVRLAAPEGDAVMVTFGPAPDAPLDAAGRARLLAHGASLGADTPAARASLTEIRPFPRSEQRAALALLESLLRWSGAHRGENAGAGAEEEEHRQALADLAAALRAGERERAAGLADAALESAPPSTEAEWVRARLRASRTVFALCAAAAGATATPAEAERVARRATVEIEAAASREALRDALQRAVAALTPAGAAPESRAARVARQAADYIRGNFRRELTLEEVAGHVGLSAAHFSTLFKREQGVGFRRFVRGLRLAEARRLLAESASTIEQVANSVGFEDAHYFSRVFARAEGMPPGEYRRRFR